MKSKNKKALGIISAIVVLLLITIGASFAYFSASLTGAEYDTTINVTGGLMGINYAGGSNITASGIYPSAEAVATKNFTVTGNNTTGIKMGYSLSLVMDENTFSVGALKYKLASTNTGANGEVVPAISEMKDLYTGPTTNLLGIGYFNQTSGSKVHTYNLEIYFPETGENQNADQNKTFKAHVAISDVACTDCLKDNILAQGGGVNTISAKTVLSFNNVAPRIIDYKEKTSEYTTTMTSSSNRAIGNGYIFNEITGTYTLTNYETSKSYGSGYIGYYTCNSTSYSNCSTMYKINVVSGTSVTNATKYVKEIKLYDLSDTGIYASEDEYGTSYYYRGAKDYLKNNVVFANQQWKIIRVNGDGSVRIMYNGTCPGNECAIKSTGSDTHISRTAYNTNYNDNKYVGYMYGGPSGSASTSRAQATTNDTNSTIKTALDNWYATNINGTGYASKVVDNIFCNDRQLQSEVGGDATGTGFGNSYTIYSSLYRLNNTKNPSLKCGLKNDRFTVNDTNKGNGALTYPVGLITASETSLGGLVAWTENYENYLYNGDYYWTLSPSNFNGDYAIAFYVYENGDLSDSDVDYFYPGARPVVNLGSGTKITGDGSVSNPYKVV